MTPAPSLHTYSQIPLGDVLFPAEKDGSPSKPSGSFITSVIKSQPLATFLGSTSQGISPCAPQPSRLPPMGPSPHAASPSLSKGEARSSVLERSPFVARKPTYTSASKAQASLDSMSQETRDKQKLKSKHSMSTFNSQAGRHRRRGTKEADVHTKGRQKHRSVQRGRQSIKEENRFPPLLQK